MTPLDAAQLLELPANAAPAQVEARFRELRAALEDKITHALTPGLQAKYRAALAEMTTAFETLILAADTASMPGLAHVSSAPAAAAPRVPSLPGLPPIPSLPPSVSGLSSPRLPPMPPAGSHGSSAVLPPLPVSAPPQPAAIVPAKKSGGKGVLIGVIAAVVVLGAAGWGVMQFREKARVEAEARQQAEFARQKAETGEKARIAAAEKAERDRVDKLLAGLRIRVAELHASFDSAQRNQLSAERELTELKARREELSAAGKSSSPDSRALAAQIQARERYIAWLNDNLPAHPAKAARAQVTEAMAARSIEAATPAIEAYAKAVRQLLADVARSRDELLITTGRLRVNSEPSGLNFILTDVHGRTSDGRTPADLPEVPLGSTTITFKREGWSDKMQTVAVTRGETAMVSANLAGSALKITSTPAGLDFVLTGPGRTERGRTPVTLADVPPGEYAATFTRDGWPELKSSVTVRAGQPADLPGAFPAAGTLKVDSKPAGASVTFKGQAVGTTPLVLPDLPPGPVAVELTLADYRPGALQGAVESGKEATLSATLRPATLTPEEAFEKLALEGKGTWVSLFHNPISGNIRLYLRFAPGSRSVNFEQTGFGGSSRNLTMVDYDPVNRIVLIAFSGLDAMNGKKGLRIEGDTLLFGDPKLTKTLAFRRQ